VIAAYPDALRLANKSDMPESWDAASLDALPVSAATGAGLSVLLAEIARRLVPEQPEPRAAVPFRADLVANLKRIRATIRP
jgi:50S ribosomal subunit-associated GTPase HflX